MEIFESEQSTLEAVSPDDDIVQSNCTCIHITHSVSRVTATCCRGSVQWGGWAGARYPGRATISWSSQCHTTSAVTQRHEHQLIRTSQTSVISAVLHRVLLENVTYIYTLCSCIAVTETVASLHIATYKMIQPEWRKCSVSAQSTMGRKRELFRLLEFGKSNHDYTQLRK